IKPEGQNFLCLAQVLNIHGLGQDSLRVSDSLSSNTCHQIDEEPSLKRGGLSRVNVNTVAGTSYMIRGSHCFR
ncbi:MAG: hypothetical protein AAF827_21510, partial [Cyanobacteria bacterium P01_D01_bin.6]